MRGGGARAGGVDGGGHMTPQDTTKRQATSALDGTLCSMHTPKMATHTGTEARITWQGRVMSRVMRAGVAIRRRGEAGGRAGLLQGAGSWPEAVAGVPDSSRAPSR